MFKNTQKLLNQMNEGMSYSMNILPDEDGYLDKECPNDACLSKFKVNADDWINLFSDEAVFCPFCGFSAPSNCWWTTEQIEQLNQQALAKTASEINRALASDVRAYNRTHSKKSFVKLSLKYSGKMQFIDLPAEALEKMEQKITCDKCGARYAVIGSAFYCPCCGNNSAKLTFSNSIDQVKAKINNLDVVRDAIENAHNKDEAARTCTSLIESSISELVMAFQRLCECVYPEIEGAKSIGKNTFQRLDDGNKLWKDLVGEGYDDWITEMQYSKLKKCFQQRHLLQHKEGIVDQDYINKSGDMSYKVGQHIIVKVEDILDYANIIEILGRKIVTY